MIATLKGDMDREKAELGVFITLQPPTEPMRQEALSAGAYTPEHFPDQQHPRLQILTIDELLAGSNVAYPRGGRPGDLPPGPPPSPQPGPADQPRLTAPCSSRAPFPLSLRAPFPLSLRAPFPLSLRAPFPLSLRAPFPLSLRAQRGNLVAIEPLVGANDYSPRCADQQPPTQPIPELRGRMTDDASPAAHRAIVPVNANRHDQDPQQNERRPNEGQRSPYGRQPEVRMQDVPQ